jgi:uncharacterized metal-binding protein YceD (DUF177 family)
MANPLLDRALPERFAQRGQVIETVEKLSMLERLAGIVGADLEALPAAKIPPKWRDAPVTISLRFGWADSRERLPMLEGTVQVSIDAVCQRCLEPCRIALVPTLHLLFVKAETAAHGDSLFEVWELEEETLCPLDVVEESLIMALPMSAMHASIATCGPLAAQVGTIPDEDIVRPFADLKLRIEKTE